MKNNTTKKPNFFFRTLIMLMFFFTAQLQAQVYVDGLLGILITGDDLTVGADLAIGRQQSKRLGYGLNIRSLHASNVSTSNTFSTIGAQYRILDNKDRFYGKLEFGSLINAKYTTDVQLIYEYERKFTPYYRFYVGCRFGKFTLGANYTYIAPFSELIYDYDDNTGEYFSTDQYRTRDFHNLQIHLGFCIDTYKE